MYYLIPDRHGRHLERDAEAIYNGLAGLFYDLDIIYPEEGQKVDKGVVFWSKHANLILNKKESVIFVGENYSWSKPHVDVWTKTWGAVVVSSKEIKDRMVEMVPHATNIYQITPGVGTFCQIQGDKLPEWKNEIGVIYKNYSRGGITDVKGMGKVGGIRDLYYIDHRDHYEMLDVYDRLKILLIPSKTEGVPRVALEALASDVYLITTSVGIIPELKEKGFMFSIMDENNLQNQIDSLSDEHILEAIKINKALIKHYRWDNIVPKWRQVFESLNWDLKKI